MIRTIITSFLPILFLVAAADQLKGFHMGRFAVPINGSQIINFGFKVQNVTAFFPNALESEEHFLVLIRNGRLVREGVKFYKGRAYYSGGRFRIRNFQEHDTTIFVFVGPDGAYRKYTLEPLALNHFPDEFHI